MKAIYFERRVGKYHLSYLGWLLREYPDSYEVVSVVTRRSTVPEKLGVVSEVFYKGDVWDVRIWNYLAPVYPVVGTESVTYLSRKAREIGLVDIDVSVL